MEKKILEKQLQFRPCAGKTVCKRHINHQFHPLSLQTSDITTFQGDYNISEVIE